MSVDLMVKTPEYYNGIRAEMLPYISSDAKCVLEVGCGEGNFGAVLKDKGAEVWGVEYSAAEARVAEKKLDRVFSGDITQITDLLPDNYFDVIVCNDVLEHLTNPYLVLEKFRAKLKPGGVVVSSIPNVRFFRTFFDFLFHKNWDYTDDGIMDKTHYRFFTINSIPKMYRNAGYDIVLHEGINASKSIRPRLWSALFFGAFSDIKFRQFATVARVKNPG